MTLKDTATRLAVLKALKDAIAAEEAAARLDAYDDMTEAADNIGVKSVDVTLPDGTKVATLSLAGGQDKPAVVDEAAFLGWVAEHRPSEVETVTRVRESYRAAVLKGASDGYAVDPQTGELVPGVGPVRSSRYTSLRYPADGREAIAAAWRRGDLAEITGVGPAAVGA